MKLSISLSAILVLLPALASASTLYEARDVTGGIYMPRHHARNFGRQRQGQGAFGGFRQGQGQNQAQSGGSRQSQGQQGGFQGQRGSGASTTAAATSAAGANRNKSKSSTAVAAVTTAAAANTNTAAANTAAANTNTAVVSAAAVSTTATGSGKNKNKGNKNNTTTTAAAAAATTDAASSTAAATDTASGTTSAAGANASVADNNPNDPNTSLTLLSELVETGLEQDGQATPEAGQVPSLTSRNNFINYCAGKTITNGQQITTGSCDPIPMGDIIPKANMPKCKFKNPKNFSTIPANQPFTVEMFLNNLQAGVFTNAQKTYYMAPQQLNNQGILIGHTHFVIQPMGAFDDPTILDPATFTFFKGVNTGADGNGVVSADVTAGVPPGNYRLASINTSANHAPAVAAVAQHGWLDDIIYFTAQ